jgi:hypothetical protein
MIGPALVLMKSAIRSLIISSESSQVRSVPAAELPDYTMDRSMRIRLNDFLSRNESPSDHLVQHALAQDRPSQAASYGLGNACSSR